MRSLSRRIACIGALAALVASSWAIPAYGYTFDAPLSRGDRGGSVRALQVRMAGWYSGDPYDAFQIDGDFGRKTQRAVKAFEAAYGLRVDGIAGRSVFTILERLQDDDGSTAHFDFEEFQQNANPNCGARANAYAGTFAGGLVSPRRTRMYVRRLMWRLEALRKKGKGNPIGINSGFRSLAYNDCIGGARASQHLYGTAADERQANVPNHRERWLAKQTQFHGIGCYSSQTHNHLDLRIENKDLASQRRWWWPERDARGRDLDEAGVPCWGETSTSTKTTTVAGTISRSLTPSAAEIARFESAGETFLGEGAD